jgi:prepilin-type processing-associated H-X9-DG protein
MNSASYLRPSRQSFTLLELLLVISIIAVLSALLLPAVKTAKESAQQAACMNNLRQIGMAFMMYGDERTYYPWGFEKITGPEADRDWTLGILPYLGGPRNMDYASNMNQRSPVIQCPSRTYKPTNIVNGYGAHARLLGKQPGVPFGDSPPWPRPFPMRDRTSEVFMLADADQETTFLGGETKPTITKPNAIRQDYNPATANNLIGSTGDNLDSEGGSIEEIRWRHSLNTRANFLFVDGHVESLREGTLKERNVKITDP